MSRTTWVPGPEYETITWGELLPMLSALAEHFALGLQAIGSALSEVAPFVGWLEGQGVGLQRFHRAPRLVRR
ncbi:MULTISPECIES: hypothetical protein [unclassified Streptomyces]|uniref:Uncharacterized protein n=1 Tax=Streptomyces doudnae TaxID=3075536 RepID=A0ABD5EKG7_9ACTN|nr:MULTISPECIES: hypothetical protein [unclassified Streptomyces]MDT0433897.1 hypothetical protein [Streptomyces sp. DSM 41981]